MPNSSLDNYYDLVGNEIMVAGTTASDTTTTDYQSEDIPYLVSDSALGQAINFIDKNAARAVQMETHGDDSDYSDFRKAPVSSIYFRKPNPITDELVIDNTTLSRGSNGSLTWEDLLSNPSKSFTMILPEGNLTINGSFDAYNAMFIVQNGSITFESMHCDLQDTVKGIFITKNGFSTTTTKNNDMGTSDRCV